MTTITPDVWCTWREARTTPVGGFCPPPCGAGDHEPYIDEDEALRDDRIHLSGVCAPGCGHLDMRGGLAGVSVDSIGDAERLRALCVAAGVAVPPFVQQVGAAWCVVHLDRPVSAVDLADAIAEAAARIAAMTSANLTDADLDVFDAMTGGRCVLSLGRA